MRKYVSTEDAINRIMDAMLTVQTRDDDLYNTGLRRAMSFIASMSAADVVEVVHGHFGKRTSPFNAPCSVCGASMNTYWKYCPMCGAVMDGGETDA